MFWLDYEVIVELIMAHSKSLKSLFPQIFFRHEDSAYSKIYLDVVKNFSAKQPAL